MSEAVEPPVEASADRRIPRPSSEEALRLSSAFYRVRNPEIRAKIIALVERYAAES